MLMLFFFIGVISFGLLMMAIMFLIIRAWIFYFFRKLK